MINLLCGILNNNIMKITKDNFVWLIVTDKAEEIWDKNVFDLYILYDDDSEALVENYKQLVTAIDNGLQIGIEVGHIELTPKQ